MARIASLMLFCSMVFSSRGIADETPNLVRTTDDQVIAAVTRSLPFLEQGGVNWMDERGCMSCHHVPYLLWTHRAAQAKGIKIDSQKLAAWDDWCRKDSNAHRNLYRLQSYDLGKVDEARLPSSIKDKLKPLIEQPFQTEAEFVAKLAPLMTEDELKSYQPVVVSTAMRAINAPDRSGGGLDVLGQLLLGSQGTTSELARPEFLESTIGLMKQSQQPDGSWVPGNQLLSMRRWSVPVAHQTTTMWATLAMASYDVHGLRRSDTVEKAIAYQRQQEPAHENMEWLATRLLFETRFGSVKNATPLRQKLIAAREDDGGWGWEKDSPSDAYTTGLAIYVLAKVSTGDDAEEIEHARKYLVTSQQADGSWLTASKNISNTTDPERLKVRDEIYHYWGTAWAALGLLESLPEVN